MYEIVRGIDNLRMILFELGASPAFIIDNLLRCDTEYTEDYIKKDVTSHRTPEFGS